MKNKLIPFPISLVLFVFLLTFIIHFHSFMNKLLVITLFTLLVSACSNHSRINSTIERDFEQRQQQIGSNGPFSFLQKELTDQQLRCMKFLYAYMALPDLTDYPEDFYLHNVNSSLQAKEEMTWGHSIPTREWMHFVLPIRVNNEHLDSCRWIFYNILKERVQNLSMKDAILEVNHWCHEKATYRPSDARTSSPLATIKTAYGRCGEESTFLVSALRSVGIPARQVYTPRWAHTDDNHAWVEAWADGKWYFLGACEPEPVLNLGWFNESASRAMLMHTKVFGRYDGPEDVMSRTNCFTEINVTENYAPTASVSIHVEDDAGQPIDSACIEFKIYNYAELYSVATKYTDPKGNVSLTAGIGDMVVWATKNGEFTFQKVSIGKDKELKLTLSPTSNIIEKTTDMDLVPPTASGQLPEVTDEQRAENTCRLQAEDSLRKAYENSFPTEREIKSFTSEWAFKNDVLQKLIPASRGNYATIQEFLTLTASDRSQVLPLLLSLSAKDLRDITLDVLMDSREEGHDLPEKSLYQQYVLCPRVANEQLTPYKKTLREYFQNRGGESLANDPELLVEWCRENIRIDNAWNPQQLCMEPLGVLKLNVTDSHSLEIFFVSAARSLGIPARINPVDGTVEYWKGEWHQVTLTNAEETPISPNGTVQLTYAGAIDSNIGNEAKYYNHFTFSQLRNGRLRLMEYPENTTTWESFAQPQPLSVGKYLLTSGTRLANGSVLAHLDFIDIHPDENTAATLTLRKNLDAVQVIGNFNSENLYFDEATQQQKSLLSTTGRGYYIIGLIKAGHEPSNHTLRDLAACKNELESWGHKIILLCETEDELEKINKEEFSELPSTVVWGTDIADHIKTEIWNNLKLSSTAMPVFLVADTFNRVVFLRQDYTIGIGQELVNTIHKL